MAYYYIEEEAWKCPKHPSKKRRTTTGVCSICLHDRLSKLCPYCANVRPCSLNCAAAVSSFYSGKIGGGEPVFCRSRSVGIPFLKSRNVISGDRRNQPEGEKSNKTTSSSSSSGNIIGGEAVFCRSKSVGIPFLKSRNDNSGDRRNLPESEKSSKTASFWWIFRKKGKENESSSMMMTSVSGGNDVSYSPGKLKVWYLVSPMKVFRQSSRAPKLIN